MLNAHRLPGERTRFLKLRSPPSITCFFAGRPRRYQQTVTNSVRPSCGAAMEAGQRLGLRLTIPQGCEPNAPLVVVLGWYGAQDRHVAKYTSLLEKEGYPSVRGVLPGPAVFSPLPLPRRRFATTLLEYLAAVDPPGERRLVFYAFSNGGAFVLEQVDQLLRRGPGYAPLAARVAGCILDSAPCYMHPLVGAAAMGQGRSLLMRVLATALFFLLALVGLITSPLRPQRFWCSMRDLRLGSRSLYIYSEDDPLCDAARLDQLIASRRAAGANVSALRWQRSQHVAHLLQHYKEYTAALFGFLRGLPQ
ncbi:hypothetical protein ABPG75_007534 [Micractinium tetrahymenae]